MAPLPTTTIKSDTYSGCISKLSTFIVAFFHDDPHPATIQSLPASKFPQTLSSNTDLKASEPVGLLRARFEPAISVLARRGVAGKTVGIIIGIAIVCTVAVWLGCWVARRHNRKI